MITMNTGPATPSAGSDAPTGPAPHHAGGGSAAAGSKTRHAAPFAVLAHEVRMRRRTVSKRPTAPTATGVAVRGAVTVDVRRLGRTPVSRAGGSIHHGPLVHTGPVTVERQVPTAANRLPGRRSSQTARVIPDTAPPAGAARSPAETGPRYGGEMSQPAAVPRGRVASAAAASSGRAAKMPASAAKGGALVVAVRGSTPRRAGPLPQGSLPGSSEGVTGKAATSPAQGDGAAIQSAPSAERPQVPVRVTLAARGSTAEELPPPATGGWRISGLTLRPPALGVGVQFRLNPPSARLASILVRVASSGTRAHVVLSVRSSAWLKVLAADRATLGSQLEPTLGRTAVEVTAGAGFGSGSSASDQADRPPPAQGLYGQGPEADGTSVGGAAAGLDLRA